jgi:nitrogen fixation protein FixH
VKPGAWWPVAIVGVLAVTVGANVVLIVAARDPNAYVVEPHYYEKALAWDSTMAIADRSAALGWQVDATLHGWTPAGTPLVVQLADSTAAPVAGAEVRAELLNNLSPAHPVAAVLADAGGGRYTATVPLPRTGLWEIRLEARRDGDLFLADLRRDATGGGAR